MRGAQNDETHVQFLLIVTFVVHIADRRMRTLCALLFPPPPPFSCTIWCLSPSSSCATHLFYFPLAQISAIEHLARSIATRSNKCTFSPLWSLMGINHMFTHFVGRPRRLIMSHSRLKGLRSLFQWSSSATPAWARATSSPGSRGTSSTSSPSPPSAWSSPPGAFR